MFKRQLDYHQNRFHEKQEDAWLGYKGGYDLILDWGRRSGKSALICEVLIEDIETYGKDCLYIALTQGQSREIMWPTLVRLIGNLTASWKSNESRLEWKHKPSGSTLSLKGADLGKDRLRGSAKRLIAVDEFAFVRDPSIVKDVLTPQIADFNGQFIFASTPKGKNHFWALKQKALIQRDRYFTSHCTMFDNPFISPEGREKLLQEYDGENDPLYRQEVLAEYIDYVGLIFALPQDSYVEKKWDLADLSHSYHYRGVDHGFKDPTACIWMAYNERKGYFQVYNEYRENKMLVSQHAEVINNLEKYHFIQTVSDIDPQLIAEYAAIGLEMTPAGKYDRESRYLRLVNALRSGKLKIADNCTKLLKEMTTMEWDGESTINSEHHYDLADSLMYIFTNAIIPEKPAPIEREPYRTINMDDLGFTGQDFG